MSDLQIRRGAIADLDTIVAFNAAMAHETEGKELDRSRLAGGVAALLNDDGKGFYLVAERTAGTAAKGAGRIVGQLMVTYEWSDWRNGVFWWIQSVYIAPEARRGGVYRALYEHLLAQARQSGNVCGLRLYVDKENRPAQATYLNLGMHQARYDLYEVDFIL